MSRTSEKEVKMSGMDEPRTAEKRMNVPRTAENNWT